MSSVKLRIDKINLDGGTQTRNGINAIAAEEYADALQNESYFPPVTVFHDGSAYWLADGFHRIEAHKLLSWMEIDADVRQGTRRDAVLYSVGANSAHGLRRTNADKRRAVETLLGDSEWAIWSNREIARRCGVDDKTVATLRPTASAEVPQIGRKVERGGTTYIQNTANIGQSPVRAAPLPLSKRPFTPLPREVEDLELMDGSIVQIAVLPMLPMERELKERDFSKAAPRFDSAASKVLAALTALDVYSMEEVAQIAQSPEGRQLYAPVRVARIKEMLEQLHQKWVGADDQSRTIDAAPLLEAASKKDERTLELN